MMRWRFLMKSLGFYLGWIAWILSVPMPSCAWSQEVWEYSPYRVNVWMSVSPTLGWNEATQAEIQRKIRERCEADFGGAWRIRMQPTPDSMYGSVLYHIDELSIAQILARELIVIVGKSDEAKMSFLNSSPAPIKPTLSTEESEKRKKLSKEQLKELEDAEARAASLNSIRTFESALDRIESFHVLSLPYEGILRDSNEFRGDPTWDKFRQKLNAFPGSLESLKSDLATGKIVAALISKNELPFFKDVARAIPTRLPWQPESLLRDFDKIFLVSIDRHEESIRVSVKEMDSILRRMSPTETSIVHSVAEIKTSVPALIRHTFSPVVRIEETDNNTATIRAKAAGLITSQEHPAAIALGDVFIPYIRRDDMNGNPTLLQPLAFTYIAATEKIDGVSLMYGAIFTSSRGALTAAKNRRTRRIGLRVHAPLPKSDMRLSFKNPNPSNTASPGTSSNSLIPVPGAEVYIRTPGYEDLERVGRTDWRGFIPIQKSELPVIQYEVPAQSKNRAIADARAAVRDPVPPPEYREIVRSTLAGEQKNSENPIEANPTLAEKDSPKSATDAKPSTPTPPKVSKGEIRINVPLYIYYIKNGETLLARLPVVTGGQAIEDAKLPDDRVRLQTEAFLRGLQNEVLDIVVRRKILEARIKQRIADNKLDDAQKNAEEWKRTKSYEKMSEQIEAVLRRTLAEREKVGQTAQKRIDTMVETTRQIMQKWLQDAAFRELEKKLNDTK